MFAAPAGRQLPATRPIGPAGPPGRHRAMGPHPGIHEPTPVTQGTTGLPVTETLPAAMPGADREIIIPEEAVPIPTEQPLKAGEILTGVQPLLPGAGEDLTEAVAVTTGVQAPAVRAVLPAATEVPAVVAVPREVSAVVAAAADLPEAVQVGDLADALTNNNFVFK